MELAEFPNPNRRRPTCRGNCNRVLTPGTELRKKTALERETTCILEKSSEDVAVVEATAQIPQPVTEKMMKDPGGHAPHAARATWRRCLRRLKAVVSSLRHPVPVMLQVELRENRIHIGERFAVGLPAHPADPDDGRVYPLPPGLGPFPVHRVEECAGRVPSSWRVRGGLFHLPLSEGGAVDRLQRRFVEAQCGKDRGRQYQCRFGQAVGSEVAR